MTEPRPDGSRDRRIEDPTNLWIIHPVARALTPWAVRRGISANNVSAAGFLIGSCAAAAFGGWQFWPLVFVGLALSIAWLVADGLDGMVARATGTSSPMGRIMDGVCDHGVFIVIYCAMALSINTAGVWALALLGGAAHAFQSSLYEGERARFHRRLKGEPPIVPTPSRSRVVRGYDWLATSPDRLSAAFDAALLDGRLSAADYGDRAARPMRFMIPLSANTRVWAIFAACLIARPALFWWFELVPLTLIAVIGMVWHRRVETLFLSSLRPDSPAAVAAEAGR
jgi:CDP-diacylglycerol---serine O-phosphatidyltransferase